ncbi:hypothetical protein RchiOBHm_Chr1g0343351 [Rosa chinensis]|uniref:Uncharacterized protein n=1 Tax=Rosa chinensis TaxID=74649 RepID=A0A2P6SE80_ROSCH|nr:hypothetical protein RchiOBHm_Chr1g0343351 [Rosa chinensis]
MRSRSHHCHLFDLENGSIYEQHWLFSVVPDPLQIGLLIYVWLYPLNPLDTSKCIIKEQSAGT